MRTTSAAFAFTPGRGATAPHATLSAVEAAPPATGGFTALLDGRPLTFTVVLLMLIVAMGFGAVHALEPGHGKTIVAAYFVGTNGRAAHAALLGLIVAATHSVGVLVIGAVTLYGTKYILPEDLYPWLTLLSGIMVVGLGIGLLASRMSGNHYLKHLATGHLVPHRHHHDHEHVHAEPAAHAHVHAAALVPAHATAGQARWQPPARYRSRGHGASHGHFHSHSPAVAAPAPKGTAAEGRAPWKSLIALGLIDGLIPTPSTLVVLLSAISVGQFALGLGLIVAFSIGLAIVLSSISLVTIGTKALLARLGGRSSGQPSRLGSAGQRIAAVAPGLAACALIAAGTTVIIRATAGTLL
jgi:ABC-type nickel/cobalt efflux system permease component RcnA